MLGHPFAHREDSSLDIRVLSGGTFCGGGGGGVPTMFSRIHLPRSTGEVRLAYDVTVSTLPWPRIPPRTLSSPSATRLKRLPYTLGIP